MKVIEGNILDIDEGIIVQQVNCKNVMGSGVAKSLYTKYPRVKSEYHKFCDKYKDLNGLPLLGQTNWVMDVNDSSKNKGKILTIVNLFGQEDFGRNKSRVYTSYTALEMGISNISKILTNLNSRTINGEPMPIYVPYGIGCGLANGNWEIVSKMLEKYNVIAVKLGGESL